jgi:hypothetical protein
VPHGLLVCLLHGKLGWQRIDCRLGTTGFGEQRHHQHQQRRDGDEHNPQHDINRQNLS